MNRPTLPLGIRSLRLLALGLASLAACAALPVAAPSAVDVQGHRGARGLLPENTLPAFQRALEIGVTTLELDTGVTGDGIVVVSHDPRISAEICHLPGTPPPAAGGAQDRYPLLKDLTLEELRRYDCGSLNPDPRRFPEPPRRNLPGTGIPTLQEVFDLVRRAGDETVRFNIEIKIHPQRQETVALEDFVAAVVAVIRDNDLEARADLQSFDWRALRRVKEIAPRIRTVALLSGSTLRGKGGQPSPWLAGASFDGSGGSALDLLQAANEETRYIDAFSPYWRLIVPGDRFFLGSSVAELQAAGYPVVPWTVNRRRHMEKVLALGVDGIITDYPDVLVEVLGRHRQN